MKVEVRCPDCNTGWSVDQSLAGEMLCPSCMRRIPLGETADDRDGAAPEGAATSVDEPTPDWMYGQVVCPRCNLHFQPRRRPKERTSARKKVLVVDDLAYFREIAKDALEPIFDVTTAATSAEARDRMTRGGIDLLVLDLTLDGCNAGRDFLAELRPKPCPILIYTAKDESEMYGEDWETLRLLGADDLVIKGMQVAESLARKASVLLGLPVDETETIG